MDTLTRIRVMLHQLNYFPRSARCLTNETYLLHFDCPHPDCRKTLEQHLALVGLICLGYAYRKEGGWCATLCEEIMTHNALIDISIKTTEGYVP